MECMEARALKSSLISELAMKSNQQVRFDELWYVNGTNSVSGEDFSVDVFLDLTNEELQGGFVGEESESVSSQDRVEDDSTNCSTFSGSLDSCSLPGELSFPVDDLEDLEWLSRFVDDSASELTLLFPIGNSKEKAGNSSCWKRSEPIIKPAIQRTPFLCFPTPVPAKTRTKRARPSGRIWSLGSLSLTESPSSSSSSSSNGSCVSSVTFAKSVQSIVDSRRPVKKQKKRPRLAGETGGEPLGSHMQRRCSHCQVQKTPQWRTGPLGPKTLCNACGVRFKSGRLCPEYRPACSPTFSGEIHSNSHRKVLEIQRKKDLAETVTDLATNPQNFAVLANPLD